eukprot:12896583-Prorocentrum_lima.AAC.1
MFHGRCPEGGPCPSHIYCLSSTSTSLGRGEPVLQILEQPAATCCPARQLPDVLEVFAHVNLGA